MDLTEHTRALLRVNDDKYYRAAKVLGNPSWRTQVWRILNEDGFKPSHEFCAALRQWAEIDPVVIEVPPGSTIFGNIGLLQADQVVAVLVLPPKEWQLHSIECAVCGEAAPRWSSSQKYCRRHDSRSAWYRSKAGKEWRKSRE